jgi:hypothetical protein
MPKDLDNTIRKNAKGPARVSGDSGEMAQHNLKDQIEADRYLNSKKAARSKGLGIRRTKLVPPGSI